LNTSSVLAVHRNNVELFWYEAIAAHDFLLYMLVDFRCLGKVERSTSLTTAYTSWTKILLRYDVLLIVFSFYFYCRTNISLFVAFDVHISMDIKIVIMSFI